MYDTAMKRTLVAASTIALLSLGCGHTTAPGVAAPPSPVAAKPQLEVALPRAKTTAPPASPGLSLSEPGDFVVYRFSGSYREAPVTLTQRVVGRENGLFILDVTIDREGGQQRLRLRIGAEGERQGELVSVAELEGSVQRPFGVAAYEQLMNDIVLGADENVDQVSRADVTIDVAGHPVACTKTTYRVRVGAHEAYMTTISSPQFPWGHLGGDISTIDGKVLYKAEIVDAGDARRDGHVAAQEDEPEIYEDDYDHFEQ
jgi:hypothetical protein